MFQSRRQFIPSKDTVRGKPSTPPLGLPNGRTRAEIPRVRSSASTSTLSVRIGERCESFGYVLRYQAVRHLKHHDGALAIPAVRHGYPLKATKGDLPVRPFGQTENDLFKHIVYRAWIAEDHI